MSPSKSASSYSHDNSTMYHGSSNSNNTDGKLQRDRSNETNTTATISSLSGIYSSDLLKEIYALSESESDSEYDAHNYSNDYNIVNISKDHSLLGKNDHNEEIEHTYDRDNMDIIDEVDLDADSESTTVASNQVPYPTPYINTSSFPAIIKNSSWTNDKPFDEESIADSLMNMSDVGDSTKSTVLPSYYSNNNIPVKEYYILPPPSPISLPSPPPTPSRISGHHVDHIIEISPDSETEVSAGRVAWTGRRVMDKSLLDQTSLASSSVFTSDAADAAALAGGAVAKGPTRSTVTSVNSRDRSYRSDKTEQSRRRLKVCVLAGCVVSLLCLIVVVVSVALAGKNRNVDPTSSVAQNGQTTASNSNNNSNVIESPASSLRATSSPSAVPVMTQIPDEPVATDEDIAAESTPVIEEPVPAEENIPSESTPMTEEPVVADEDAASDAAAWVDETPSPSGSPTVQPTPAPTPDPTAAPTPEPTPEPTPNPTADPTVRPTEAGTAATTSSLTCASRVSVNQDCYFMSENVLVVDFDNCDPQPDDWIGVYPNGADFVEESSGLELLTDNWITWAWTCGDQACDVSPTTNSFAFSVDPEDPAYELFELRAFLIRASSNGPPYQVMAKSEPFALADPCNP